ncbi:hypothetical protein B0H19DRAFT_1082552 [Mycena capillaripes]|nr:hypothetical protein B0H19DRAFT_1082552 [Mycena capillaripes]
MRSRSCSMVGLDSASHWVQSSSILAGIYISLFLLSLYSLSRRKAPRVKLLLVASWVMAILGTMQMAVDIAIAAIYARSLQHVVHSKVPPQFMASLNVLEMLQGLLFVLNKTVVILPALFILSDLVVGILVSTPGSGMTDCRIPYSLGTAINVYLTAFTGKLSLLVRWNFRELIYSPSQPAEYCGPDVQHVMLVLTTRLESGAIYCVLAILLMITFSLKAGMYSLVFSIAQQMINIIPTFTLVYIGLTNMAETPLPANALREVRSDQPTPLRMGPRH